MIQVKYATLLKSDAATSLSELFSTTVPTGSFALTLIDTIGAATSLRIGNSDIDLANKPGINFSEFNYKEFPCSANLLDSLYLIANGLLNTDGYKLALVIW